MSAHETSGVTTGLVLRCVSARGGPSAVDRLLRRADVPHDAQELQDVSGWVSYDTRIRLFEAAAEVLDDPRCTFSMGATALRSGLNHSLVLLLRALGTPRQVYRQLPRSVPKFSTTSTMEVVECGATYATLRYRLHEGYVHSRLDCLYAQGLISTVPEIFGLPTATVVHEECESDGAPACVYHLTWARRSRWPFRRRRGAVDPELVALRGQLEALQSAASDLTSSDDLTAAVRRITDRAAAAVLAPSYLLAVVDPGGGPPLVHSKGLGEERAAELVGRLLERDDLGPCAVVVDIASSRRMHGRLAALYPAGQQGPADERRLLSAYAGHAAAALDLLVAVETSRRGESRSAALLALAHELRAATDADEIARVVVATTPALVGCDASTVLLWEPRAGVLRPIASSGLTDAESTFLQDTPIRPEDTPELVEMLAQQETTVLSAETTTPALSHLLHGLGVVGLVATPLIADGKLMGVATAAWRVGRMPPDPQEGRTRLVAVGEYAATALQNARLLSTVRHQSLHDDLTGLPNRVLFSQTLERALQEATDDSGVAVLFCDLDRFKHVNDTLGHAAGDELLRQVAARLQAVLRSGDLVGRLSGDEFALLLPAVSDMDSAAALAQKVVGCFTRPFRLDGGEHRITTSVGVGLHSGPGGVSSALLRSADAAMYAAKQRGRNQIACAHDERPEQRPAAGPSLVGELRAAVDAGQLRLFVQPLVELGPAARGDVDRSTGHRTVGAEALIRWEHPRLGLLTPAAFLPLAEEAGLVVELDLWAVRTACQTLASWPQPAGPPLHIAVNLSCSTLLDPRLHGTVRRALASNGLAPHRLYLEVVESRALVDLPEVVNRLTELRQLGVKISLDDFGTGYSTLTWLQRLPVDQLKIDRSFTAALPDDAASLAAVRGALALAREFDIELVAEGVETVEQLDTLRSVGCTLAQGYLLGRPSPGPPGLPPSRGARPEGVPPQRHTSPTAVPDHRPA